MTYPNAPDVHVRILLKLCNVIVQVYKCSFCISGSVQLFFLQLRQNYDVLDLLRMVHLIQDLSLTTSLFSPAYVRHVGPTSLQYRISSDVGLGRIHKL